MVRLACRGVGEPGVAPEIGPPDHRGQGPPRLVVAHRDGEPLVVAAAAVEPLRRPPGVPIAPPPRLDPELAVDEHVAEVVEDVLALVELDELSAAGALPGSASAAMVAKAAPGPDAASM